MGITFIGNPFDGYVPLDSCTGVSIKCESHSCDNVQCGTLVCVSHHCNNKSYISSTSIDDSDDD